MPPLPIAASPTRLSKVFALGLTVTIIGVTVALVLLFRQYELQKWEKQSAHTVSMLAEMTNQQMRFAYHAVESISEHVTDRWAVDASFLRTHLSSHDFHQYLQEKAQASRQIESIAILDASGHILASSSQFPAPSYGVQDADYFQVHQENLTRGTYLSRPARSRLTGNWVYYLSRRLSGADGEFIGVVVLGLVPGFDMRFYEGLGPFVSVSLMREDFVYLSHWPINDLLIGQPALNSSAHALIAEQHRPFGVRIAPRSQTERGRDTGMSMTAVLALKDFPLIVSYAVDEELYLADWSTVSSAMWVAALCALLALAGGFSTLLRLAQQRDQDMQRALNLQAEAERHTNDQARLMKTLSQQQRSQQEMADRLSAVFQSAADGIIMLDDAGCIEAINPAASLLYGYQPEEVIGKHSIRLAPHGKPDLLALVQHQPEFGKTGRTRIEDECMRKNGSLFLAELSFSEYTLADKRKLIVIVRDITERRRMERMKSEFISTVSHELRTPLTAIRGALGLVLGGVGGTLPDKTQSLLAMASKNCDSLARLINDLLDIQKIEAGKMDFTFERLPLQQLLNNALLANQTFAQNLGVTLQLEHELGGLMVLVDAGRFAQVMANLLSNASKYSPAGGIVRMLTLLRDPHTVRIEVIDQGPGIPENFRHRIFEKFSQADSSNTRAKGGTGLGLAISRAIVEHMQGHIGYYMDESGSGTHFYIDLPLPAPERNPG